MQSRFWQVRFWQVMALATLLTVGAPALAHVGHGDEFEATGDVQRVEVNPATDGQLGIQVAPIEPAADGSPAVLVPAVSLVEAEGNTFAFVEYDGFYEPVPVTTGASQGDLIEVTEGLSVGEQLVTQGGLTLYAQSRRSQPSETTATPADDTVLGGDAAIEAVTESGTDPVDSSTAGETASQSGFPLLPVVGIGTVVLLVVGGTLATLKNGKRP